MLNLSSNHSIANIKKNYLAYISQQKGYHDTNYLKVLSPYGASKLANFQIFILLDNTKKSHILILDLFALFVWLDWEIQFVRHEK